MAAGKVSHTFSQMFAFFLFQVWGRLIGWGLYSYSSASECNHPEPAACRWWSCETAHRSSCLWDPSCRKPCPGKPSPPLAKPYKVPSSHECYLLTDTSSRCRFVSLASPLLLRNMIFFPFCPSRAPWKSVFTSVLCMLTNLACRNYLCLIETAQNYLLTSLWS